MNGQKRGATATHFKKPHVLLYEDYRNKAVLINPEKWECKKNLRFLLTFLQMIASHTQEK